MVLVALIVFLLLHLSPGDPAAVIAGETASAEEVEGIRVRLGLDRPLVEQFGRWLLQVAQGNLGVSIFSNLPVTQLVLQRVEPTLSLALVTLVPAALIAVGIGVAAAARAGRAVDHGLMILVMLALSSPVFVTGYALVLLFAIQLQWFPVQGYSPLSAGLGPFIKYLILPGITLGLGYVALIARVTRASMLEVLAQDYIRTARSKGLGRQEILLLHALKNAAVPVATIIGIGVAMLISGVVVTESLFNIPGMGRLVVEAIARRDYPVIQGVTLIFSAVYVLVNLMVDLSYLALDPRVRY